MKSLYSPQLTPTLISPQHSNSVKCQTVPRLLHLLRSLNQSVMKPRSILNSDKNPNDALLTVPD